ncbi:MAG: hypothetical protein RLZZ127_158 [Planctomycetota bacterium]|jgi:signal transduction histidine kinase
MPYQAAETALEIIDGHCPGFDWQEGYGRVMRDQANPLAVYLLSGLTARTLLGMTQRIIRVTDRHLKAEARFRSQGLIVQAEHRLIFDPRHPRRLRAFNVAAVDAGTRLTLGRGRGVERYAQRRVSERLDADGCITEAAWSMRWVQRPTSWPFWVLVPGLLGAGAWVAGPIGLAIGGAAAAGCAAGWLSGRWITRGERATLDRLIALHDDAERIVDEVEARRQRLELVERNAVLELSSARVLHEMAGPVMHLRAMAEEGADRDGRLKSVVDRLSAGLDSLRSIDRRAPLPDLEAIDGADLLERCLATARVVLGSGVLEPSPAAPAVRVATVPDLVLRIIDNLCRNAEAARDPVRPLRVTIALEQTDGGWSLTVADTGIGMSEAVAGSLDRPGFTTRPGGMGMGLALCRAFAAAAGGTLRLVTTVPGEGTVWAVELAGSEQGGEGGGVERLAEQGIGPGAPGQFQVEPRVGHAGHGDDPQ